MGLRCEITNYGAYLINFSLLINVDESGCVVQVDASLFVSYTENSIPSIGFTHDIREEIKQQTNEPT